MNDAIWLAAAAVAMGSVGSVMEAQVKSAPIAPARDGNIAIMEELCAARKKRTAAAYDLFIARHPEHPLAAVARREREALKK